MSRASELVSKIVQVYGELETIDEQTFGLHRRLRQLHRALEREIKKLNEITNQ